jgi:hypothetical protein
VVIAVALGQTSSDVDTGDNGGLARVASMVRRTRAFEKADLRSQADRTRDKA